MEKAEAIKEECNKLRSEFNSLSKEYTTMFESVKGEKDAKLSPQACIEYVQKEITSMEEGLSDENLSSEEYLERSTKFHLLQSTLSNFIETSTIK